MSLLSLLLSLYIISTPITHTSLTTGGSEFLTGDFQTDVYKLKNCSLLDNILNRRHDLGRSLNSYERRLYRIIGPWYIQNCSQNKFQ